VQQSVDLSSVNQQLTAAELGSSQPLSHSEPMAVDIVCPVEYSLSQSVATVSQPSVSSDAVSASLLVLPDVNFNCSSNHICVPDDQFHVDITTLQRPALFDENVVDSSRDQEKIGERNDDDVPVSHDSVSVDNEFRFDVHQPVVLDKPASEVGGSDENFCADDLEHSDDIIPVGRVSVPAGDEFHVDIAALRRPAMFDKAASEVVDNGSREVCADDVGHRDDNVQRPRDAVFTVDAVAEANIHRDAVMVSAVSADNLFTVSSCDILPVDEDAHRSRMHDTESSDDNMPIVEADGGAGDVARDAQDLIVDDDCKLLSQQPPCPTSDALASADVEKHADETSTCSDPHVSEVMSENVAIHTRSVEVATSNGSCVTMQPATPEIAASVNIVTSVQRENEDLNRETMDVTENECDALIATEAAEQSDAGPCADDVQGEVEKVDERHEVMENVVSDAVDVDVRHSTSPASMFVISNQLTLLVCVV